MKPITMKVTKHCFVFIAFMLMLGVTRMLIQKPDILFEMLIMIIMGIMYNPVMLLETIMYFFVLSILSFITSTWFLITFLSIILILAIFYFISIKEEDAVTLK